MTPVVSIIVPTYNCKELISETVESVKDQSFKDWELLLVDDCSSDGTQDLLKSFSNTDTRIKVHLLRTNSGRPAIPRNVGLNLARGKYVAFLDADDIWHRQKLSIQLDFLNSYGCKFISSRLLDFRSYSDISDQVQSDTKLSEISYTTINHSKLLRKNCIPNSSVCIEWSLVHHKRFIEDIGYKAIEDYHLWLRLHQKIPYSIKIEKPLLFYRRSDSGISKSKISMLKKNHMLYSEYRINGKRMGRKKYFYLASYMYFSLLRQLMHKF